MHEEETKLGDVASEEAFRSQSGHEVKNLRQLLGVLNEISEESFKKHVNPEKNDFANWIRHSVKDDELADSLETTTDLEATKGIVQERINKLEQNLEIKRIKENIDTLENDVGIDREPEAKPPENIAPEPPKENQMNEQHPFEHLKKSVHSRLRDIMIGVVVGLIIGYLVGNYVMA